jgi:hypothetical protein
MIVKIGSALIIILLLSGCDYAKQKDGGRNETFSSAHLMADTIFYPVRIKNIDPNDEWADSRLQKLNRKKLVDDIFSSVYDGKATAYHYLTDAPLSIDDIKELEQRDEFVRDNVVELEFRETWWFNATTAKFEKEIISILVAYAVFEDDGNLRGLKAAFYIKNNP